MVPFATFQESIAPRPPQEELRFRGLGFELPLRGPICQDHNFVD